MKGLLAVWNDCLPEFKDRYHLWYETDHIPERIAIEGFLTATRYEAIRPIDESLGREFFTSYELASLSALASPEYQALLMTPCKKTQEMMSVFRNMWRSVAKLERQSGCYAGSWLLTVRLGDGQTRTPEENLQQAKRALYEVLSDKNFFGDTEACRWRTFETVVANQSKQSKSPDRDFASPSPEQKFRVSRDLIPDFFCLIEFRRESSLNRTADKFFPLLVNDLKKLCAVSIDRFTEIGRTEKRFLISQ